MASLRFTTRINRPVGDVWDVISTPDAIVHWFPGVLSAETRDNVRKVRGGSEEQISEIEDRITTNDSALRRFQYHVEGVEGHLATVDVLEIGNNDTLVIYSVELADPALAAAWTPWMEQGVNGLKRYLESE